MQPYITFEGTAALDMEIAHPVYSSECETIVGQCLTAIRDKNVGEIERLFEIARGDLEDEFLARHEYERITQILRDGQKKIREDAQKVLKSAEAGAVPAEA